MLVTMNLDNLVLRPNCLLTKSPLVFIPGPRSLFFYQKPFGLLPEFLFEHGYISVVLSLPFRALNLRRHALKIWLMQNADKKFHFITDSATLADFSDLLDSPQTQSITVLQIKSAPLPVKLAEAWIVPQTASASLTYLVHQLFSFCMGVKSPPYSLTFSKFNTTNYDRFLDHCINLAENEIYA